MTYPPLSAWDGEWAKPGISRRTFNVERYGARYILTSTHPFGRAVERAVLRVADEVDQGIRRARRVRVGALRPEVTISVDADALDAACGVSWGTEICGLTVEMYGRWPE